MEKRRIFSCMLCIIYTFVVVFSAVGCTRTEEDNIQVQKKQKEETIAYKDDGKKEKSKVEEDEVKEDKPSEGEDGSSKNDGSSEMVEVKPVKQGKLDGYEVNFMSESVRKVIDVPYSPSEIEAKVRGYTINDDLSNIINLDSFGEFSPEQKKLLAKNGFVVNPTKEEQLFYIYEKNEYKKIPSFITTDSVLQVYHIFYDYSLRTLESEKLLGFAEELTESMLNKSILLYEEITNEEIKKAQLKNIAYFATAALCLEKNITEDVPEEAKKMALEEYELIKEQAGFEKSKIFPYMLDYSQYIPRGHYTRNEDFKRYFRAMMWYGQAPFPLYKNTNGGDTIRNTEQTLQALLIAYSIFLNSGESKDMTLWENIYDPTVFYVGVADDLNIYHYKDLLVSTYGEEPDINELNKPDKLDQLYKEAEKLPEPKIQADYTSVDTPVGKQFRLMGQRYIPDSEIIQELVQPIKRPIPSGLDVMGVLGSERAYDLQINHYHEDKKWPEYVDVFAILRDEFSKLSEDKWKSNMYYGWIWTLKGLLKEFGEGYPSFMLNEAWTDKSLSTALGSWSELKHDTVLYGKQSGVECGGGEEPPQIKGYVEPNVEVYEKLLWLTKYSRENLKERDTLPESLENKMQSFEDLLQFLVNCSVKELKNEELSSNEYYELLIYGGYLEYLTSSFAGDGMRWYEITSETDKNMAVIADIHTIAPNEFSNGGYFEVGVGPAYEIYVVVPIDGKLYLTRGAVFSYFEFDSIKRLTDEEWQKMIKEDRTPSQPDWMKNFIKGGKEEVPTPANPYSTGC
ncbi:DUF3160 domain-containing protein [Wukongibacter sp. M2B1]|uniref:DUF3160 domain-containing protein n=1 Tax=Wukongibacter sp. M2B1 TaxID=3088895 RepID=UPI003D794057